MPNIRQAEQTNKTALQTPQKTEAKTVQYLDKLEPSDTAADSKGYRGSKESLQRRAKYKSIAVPLMSCLIGLDSPLNKNYRLTRKFCCDKNMHEGVKITSKYCGFRWCPVCSRIRTGKLINGYLEVVEQMNEPHLVTLTDKLCSAKDLEQEIKNRNYTWSAILKHATTLRNRGKINFRLKGIRKIEITARPNGMFNLHFHIIMEGKDAANFTKVQWLSRNQTAIRNLQDIRKADANSLKELFKYLTKFWTENKQTGEINIYTPIQMDTIFRAISGLPTVIPFGGIRMIRDKVEALQSLEYEGIEPTYDISEWNQSIKDWVTTYGEIVSEYTPTQKDLDFIDKIDKQR